jgi:CspA family cold shock protein
MSSTNDTNTPSEHLTGRIKWFNNKAGYGFITVTDGSRSGSDIFVHHSAIAVENQYKYLVQGEYVEFELVKTESQTHEYQASNVSGIKGGKLMCETRHELKLARNEYKTTKQPEEQVAEPKMPRQRAPRESDAKESSAPRQRRNNTNAGRGQGPRESTNARESAGDKKEWTVVSRNGPQKGRGRPPRQGSTIITIQSK